jgi:hypothetical protein
MLVVTYVLSALSLLDVWGGVTRKPHEPQRMSLKPVGAIDFVLVKEFHPSPKEGFV